MTEPLEPIVEMLRAEVQSTEAHEVSAEGREQAVRAIRAAIAKTKRRSIVRRRIASGLGVAAAALFAIGARQILRPSNPTELTTRVHGDVRTDEERIPEVAHLKEGMSLESATAADLEYASGTSVHLEPQTKLVILSQGAKSNLALNKGSLTAHVAKLKEGERFLISTPDARVEVRGTKFTVRIVARDPRCGESTTRVDVAEGIVRVEGSGEIVDVRAGESWPRCEPAAPPQPVVISSAVKPTSAPSHTEHAAVHSTLAAQNDMFADALLKKRSGDNQGALEALDKLVKEHPKGPLTESAYAEKFRISRSAEAARAYLRRYPEGFARSEAEALLH